MTTDNSETQVTVTKPIQYTHISEKKQATRTKIREIKVLAIKWISDSPADKKIAWRPKTPINVAGPRKCFHVSAWKKYFK